MSKLKKIVLSGLLLALLIVTSRFLSVKTPILVISFSFIPIAFAAILLGPGWTMLIATIGDLIGSLLFPSGSFFIGYTISAFISGLIYGLLLYKKPDEEVTDRKFIFKIILSTLIVCIFVNLILTTLWVSITSGKAYIVLMSTRAIKQAIMIPIQIGVIYCLEKALRKPMHKYLRD